MFPVAQAIRVECPHCKNESKRIPVSSINVARNPEMRSKVQDLSCFRWRCPVCGTTSLVMEPCLYHDLANSFMVWLYDTKPESADFEPLTGYTLRWTADFNAFREKINILERGLDDRAVEIMKYLLCAQLQQDLDVVELVFHDLNERTGEFRFAAVLSDGMEQYISMPAGTYGRIAQDVEERLFTASRDFSKIDMEWAHEALELLHGAIG